MFRVRVGLIFSLHFLVCASLFAQTETKGQRVFYSGHSFHVFMPGILADIAKKAKIADHTQLGVSSIGGSRVWQHWAPAQTVVAKDFKDAKLPLDVISTASTNRFVPTGEITIETSEGPTVVTYAGMKGNAFIGGKGGVGTLKAGAKITAPSNTAKEALKTGKVDVFTMSPIYLPDDGIENFVKLGLEHNPKMRFFVQENWLPFDVYDPTYKTRPAKVDHNAFTVEELRKLHAPYFKSFDAHVAELNAKYKTQAVRVAPVGQAVIKLREAILAGKAPGLKEQTDLFTDAIGHAKAPLAAQVAYVYYALIYEKSPVGLPVPAVIASAPEAEKLNRLLQEIAWDVVTSHPLSGVKVENRPVKKASPGA